MEYILLGMTNVGTCYHRYDWVEKYVRGMSELPKQPAKNNNQMNTYPAPKT